MYIYSWNCGRNGVVWQRSCSNARSSVRLDEVFFSMVLHEVALQAKLFLTQFLCMCEFSFFSFSNTLYICVCLLFLYIYIYIYILCNLSPTWYSSSINLCYSIHPVGLWEILNQIFFEASFLHYQNLRIIELLFNIISRRTHKKVLCKFN